MVFFLALLPTVVQLETLNLTGYLQIAAIICVFVPLILGAYAVAATRARQLFTSQRAPSLESQYRKLRWQVRQ